MAHNHIVSYCSAFLQLNSIYEAGDDGNIFYNGQVSNHLFLTLLNPEPLLAQVPP